MAQCRGSTNGISFTSASLQIHGNSFQRKLAVVKNGATLSEVISLPWLMFSLAVQNSTKNTFLFMNKMIYKLILLIIQYLFVSTEM